MARMAILLAGSLLIVFGPASASAQVGGIYIDGKGMLRHTSRLSKDRRLAVLRADAVGKPESTQLAAGSSLRKISLQRLQETLRRLHRTGKPLPADVRFLAGLTRVRYVFLDPEQRDVILAGPAEVWTQLPSGEIVGRKSGRPVLHLEDLIAALRYAFTEKDRPAFIGCSIDPTQQGLKNYRAYLRRLGGRLDRSRLRQIFNGMERSMGPQQVRVFGVDEHSRFALVMVAADYRLKRLAMGHDPSPVKGVVNYLDLAARGGGTRRQPQHRWWFNAEFDAIRHSPDQLAFELVGEGVKAATARSDLTQKKGQQKHRVAPAARRFTESVNRSFAKLAAKTPVFAELQNLVGLSVAAELAARSFYGEDSQAHGSQPQAHESQPKAHGSQPQAHGSQPVGRQHNSWKPSHFLDRKACPVTQYPVPKTVPSIASSRRVGGRNWIISVSGGVDIHPTQITGKSYRKPVRGGELEKLRRSMRPAKTATRWWWD